METNSPATLYTIFLPLNHNDGRQMRLERLQFAEQAIRLFAGGLTRFSPGIGLWIDQSGKTYRDFVMPIQTTVTFSGPETHAWFARWAAEMAVVLEQQQVFLFAQSVFVIEPVPLLRFQTDLHLKTPRLIDSTN